jgi:hypothetical protein
MARESNAFEVLVARQINKMARNGERPGRRTIGPQEVRFGLIG